MLTDMQIQQIYLASRSAEEFAQACYLAGRREQQQNDAERAKKFGFSPCIGSAIAEEILKDCGDAP